MVEVAQLTGDNVARCIAMSSTDGLVRGTDAVDTGESIKVPVGDQCLGRVFNLLGEPVDNMPGRYTYLGGSPTGGAVIYDNGKFLYSHHATDPCSNRLVNAFDMVRLHRLGDKDDAAQPGTPTNRLPSYKAMCELAVEDKDVAALMSQ